MATWDAVWLNDEIDLLVWRIGLLRDVVDHVLVVEGDRFFSGDPKQSTYLANVERLTALGVDLHHVIVPLDAVVDTAWDRENQQRRGMAAALETLATTGDLLLVCDVDEVPRPEVVRRLARELDRPVRLHLQHLNYFANWAHQAPWRNSAWAYRHGQAADHRMLWVHLGDTHTSFDGYVEDFLPDAGWHLSFLGGADMIRTKWAAYSHQEYNTRVDRHPGHLERCFRHGTHFQGRAQLRKISRADLDPHLLTFELLRPDFFRFEPETSDYARRSYRSWTWIRRTFTLPERLRLLMDDRPVVFWATSPGLYLLDRVLTGARRRRQPVVFPVAREMDLSPLGAGADDDTARHG